MSITLLPGNGSAFPGTPTTRLRAAATKTYRVDWGDGSDAVGGHVDGLAAVRQAVFKYLQTWRGWYPIYDRNYGIELHDLPRMERGYIRAVVRERIRDALSTDERILDVDSFAFEDGDDRSALGVSFRVRTIYGDITQRIGVIS